MLRTRIVTTSIEVTCSDRRVLKALGGYFTTAEHPAAAENRIAITIGFDGLEYTLPSGRKEISPDIAAEAGWQELSSWLQQCLAGFLQISGVCLDGGGRRILLLGEDGNVLRALAMHCLSQGLSVPSATGVCVRGGLATPFALPIEVSEPDLMRLSLRTGLKPRPHTEYDEMGRLRFQVTPADFGRRWIAAEAPVDEIILLTWNPGGWSGFGRRDTPWLSDQVLNAAHIPAGADASTKLRLVAEARRLSASTAGVDLHLGRLEDAPRLLAGRLGITPAHG